MINSQLGSTLDRSNPVALASNGGCSYQGNIVLGQGFTITREERAALIAKNRRNAQRIFPYLGGEEVNTSPEQSFHRYVISFGQMNLEEAEAWPDLLSIVRDKVKPERDKNNRANYRARWWQFGEYRPALFEAIAPLTRCLVTSEQSTHIRFTFQPTDRIFSHKLYVFPLDTYSAFAVLQSSIHGVWARVPQAHDGGRRDACVLEERVL